MELWVCLGNQGFDFYVDHDLGHGDYFHEVHELDHGVGHEDLGEDHEDYGALHDGNFGHDGDLELNHGEYHYGGVGHEVPDEGHGVGHDGDLALNHGDFHDEHHYVGVLDEDHDGDLGMYHGL